MKGMRETIEGQRELIVRERAERAQKPGRNTELIYLITMI